MSSVCGFFQVSQHTLEAIIELGGGPNELGAYIVLCSGVDGRSEHRLSTHGANSVAKRCGTSRYKAELSIDWLCDHGLITPVAVESAKGHSPRWAIEDDPDLAFHKQLVEPFRCNPAEGPPLSKLLHQTRITWSISHREAVTDALLLYFHLASAQEFGDFAGVPPRIWHGKCTVDDEDDILADIKATGSTGGRSGLETATLLRCREAGIEAFDDYTLLLFGSFGGKATPQERLSHALAELLRLGLVYRALVLWKGDPTTSDNAEPIATLYVRGRWAQEVDAYASRSMNEAYWRSGVNRPSVDFDPEGGQPVFDGAYRYLAPTSAIKTITPVMQLRARYWPANAAVSADRGREKSRTEAYCEFVMECLS